MAIDGSFRLEVELQRFLARCPKLASTPYFDDLLKKGEKVTEKEVVNAVVGLFLHPNYTIPLVGRFRPIAQNIVEQPVSSLHLVPNLRSDDSSVTFDEDKFLREVSNAEVVSIIEFYVRSEKGLYLHELACLAFCRALDLVPFLMGHVLNYFKSAPPPFKRIRSSDSVSKALSIGSTKILNVVRTSYRFLVLEPEIFTRLWDWSCFLDLVRQSANLDLSKDTELRMNVSDIRWCGIQILLVVLKLSFKASTKFNLDSGEALQSLLRWQEFCMDVSLERAGWYLESSVEEKTATFGKCININDCHYLEPYSLSSISASSRMLHETVPLNHSSMLETRNSGNPFILTSAVKKSFEMVMIAVSQRWPALLYRPAGSGKTALICKLARDLGRRGWKERVKVSVDLENQKDGPEDLVDETADEYGYSAEFEKGTSQALGPATADQIDKDLNRSDLERDIGTAELKDPTTEMEIEMQPSDARPVRMAALNPDNSVKNQLEMSESDNPLGEYAEVNADHEINNSSESTVSVRRSYMTEDVNQLSKLSMKDYELGKAHGFEMSADLRDDAAALWRRYELLTSRLSQELAEQLRLVMEPTLASKLQGDYKTGKRINMKKVIPYIASHYRKDKIWLRRTRPNKRDYQVVIAMDDSRSMSESCCGGVAIEALVTVCPAISQLEVGNLAVASFGQKGNIRLLHDFDQPFTSEAGIKMISSLTFKQENTIVDDPMVDLLRYLKF